MPLTVRETQELEAIADDTLSAILEEHVLKVELPVTARTEYHSTNVFQMVCQSVLNLARAVLTDLLETFPWKHRETMKQRVPFILRDVQEDLLQGHLKSIGNIVDRLLPLPDNLTLGEQEVVLVEVLQRLGRMPTSRLEVYELVYHALRSREAVKLRMFLFE